MKIMEEDFFVSQGRPINYKRIKIKILKKDQINAEKIKNKKTSKIQKKKIP